MSKLFFDFFELENYDKFIEFLKERLTKNECEGQLVFSLQWLRAKGFTEPEIEEIVKYLLNGGRCDCEIVLSDIQTRKEVLDSEEKFYSKKSPIHDDEE